MKKIYYDKAQKHIKEKYQTDLFGRVHGLRELYDEEGHLYMRGHYKHNIPHGLFEHFFKDGGIDREMLKNGKREGRSESFRKGLLTQFWTYHLGKKEGPFETYWNNGNLNEKGSYQNDLLEGPAEHYRDDGTLSEKFTYHLDKKEGKSIEYFRSGTIRARSIFHKGKREGIGETYYPNGKLFYRATYVQGKMQGPFEAYYDNGQIAEKGAYQDGNFIGDKWTPDGTKT